MSALTIARRRVSFEVFGVAQPKGNARGFVPQSWATKAAAEGKAPRVVITLDNSKTKGWEQLVAEQAQTVAADGLFLGPVVLTVTFRLPRPASLAKRYLHHTKKPDLDKLLRATNDALTGVLYTDDSQVVDLHARKTYTAIGSAPCARITLEEACDPDPSQLDLIADATLFS